ncbi:hypothetical protein S349_65 [Shewanella sp. phage 3/49]|uniref:hypothetical protein n=1 Tax=Shewanella sp. phage 3/49 TaxID=1458863 RepID=UPI0004F6CC80|nr:hypothetical protein S349_65 [Shewanella sp. phage 3/49]AHK11855.1 hypothetical protein S349_65 [Shewanella sp. phage 3/49]
MSELKMQNIKKELAPCPFCGGEACAEERDQYDTTIVLFGCTSCEIWCESECQWNTRTPQSEWISVDDRLPDESHDDCYDEHNVYCKHPSGDKSEDIVTTVDWTEHGWFDCKQMSWNECVTHWMPLPTPPKDLK